LIKFDDDPGEASKPSSFPACISMKVIAGVFRLTLPVVGKIFIAGAISDKSAEPFRGASQHVTMG